MTCVDRLARFPLDHRQDRGAARTRWSVPARHAGQGLHLRHDHQPPEPHRSIGQGLGSAGGDALAQGDDFGRRVLTLPADLGPLERGAAAGPSLVQTLELEQAFGEALFEDGRVSEAAGMGGGSWLEMRSDSPYVVPKTRNTPLIES